MDSQTSPKTIRIATRKSKLALWQANWVKDQLQAHGVDAELVLVETQGDKQLTAFRLMKGQGFFTKAVQDEVLKGNADIAVHSLKDLPSAACEGLTLIAIPQRVDPRECLLARPEAIDKTAKGFPLKDGVKVGTSAVRRQKQIAQLRPDLQLAELRGNVPTRIQKCVDGEYDAIILAAAGLTRLEITVEHLTVFTLEPDELVPAPGQGALAIECRDDDTYTQEVMAKIHDADAAKTVNVERGLMKKFDGGCQLALGAHATSTADERLSLLVWYEGKTYTATGAAPDELITDAFQFFAE